MKFAYFFDNEKYNTEHKVCKQSGNILFQTTNQLNNISLNNVDSINKEYLLYLERLFTNQKTNRLSMMKLANFFSQFTDKYRIICDYKSGIEMKRTSNTNTKHYMLDKISNELLELSKKEIFNHLKLYISNEDSIFIDFDRTLTCVEGFILNKFSYDGKEIVTPSKIYEMLNGMKRLNLKFHEPLDNDVRLEDVIDFYMCGRKRRNAIICLLKVMCELTSNKVYILTNNPSVAIIKDFMKNLSDEQTIKNIPVISRTLIEYQTGLKGLHKCHIIQKILESNNSNIKNFYASSNGYNNTKINKIISMYLRK